MPSPITANPFYLTLLQLTTQTFILGFTAPSSFLRLAALPIQPTSEYLIFQNINDYVRPSWAQSYAATCWVLFILNYLERALLRKWSFEAQGSTLQPPSAKFLPPKRTPKPQDTVLNRLLFAFQSSLSFRDIGTWHESRNVPPFSTTDPSYIPTRTLLSFILHYLAYDIIESLPAPNPTLFTPSSVPIFFRPSSFSPITVKEIANRIITTAVAWFASYCLLSIISNFLALISVATGFTPVSSWPPLFGSFSHA